MHTKSKYPFLRHIDFMLIDLLSLFLALSVAFPIKFHGVWFVSGVGWENYVWGRLVSLMLAADIVLTLLLNPYSGIFKRKYYMEAISALRLVGFNAIAVALVLYIFKVGFIYSRTVFILTYVFYFFLSLIMKYIWKKLVLSGVVKAGYSKYISLFIAASKDNIDSVLANVSAGDYDPYEIKGLYIGGYDGSEYKGFKLFGSDFAKQVVEGNISDVLIALPPAEIPAACYKTLIDNAVNVHIDAETLVGMQTENQFVSDVGILKTLSVGAFTFSPGQLIYLVFKRLIDLCLGLIGAIVLIPISLAVKLAYLKNGDKGSIFYTQSRIGADGREIRILKYRTMVQNADAMLERLLLDPKNKAEWEANQKLVNDPRITKAGAFLRKTSLDELPQVVNLIKGDMSLVGPRPLIKGELEAHGGLKLYQRVKPGITGWWACNGRSNIDYRERLELEYYYIKHFSLQLDILCVFRTILAVIKREGAK